MKMLRLWNCILSLLLLLFFNGCGGGNDASSGSTGTLSLNLTDATTNEYKGVYITIEEVQVHKDNSDADTWQTVATPDKTRNVLELVNGVRESLGITEIDAGHYTQMRLIIGETPDNSMNMMSTHHPHANYIIDNMGDSEELKIPSGDKTGIKIVHGFDINDNQTTDLILDFDVSRSIVKAGNSGKWLLKPTIKVFETREGAIIQGKVTVFNGIGIEGAVVSAQTYSSDANDIKDEVIVEASTITNESGSYTLFLHSGAYSVIVYKDGHSVAYTKLTVQPDTTQEQDFILSPALVGTITGDVTIQNGKFEQHATISIRQEVEINGNTEQIEVKAFHVASGTAYSENLPEGDYSIAASTDGEETQLHSRTVSPGAPINLDITF